MENEKLRSEELSRIENEKIRIEKENAEKEIDQESNIETVNKKRQKSIIKTRSKANVLQEKNAIQVVTHNERLLGKASIGDIVFFFRVSLIVVLRILQTFCAK
jgi:hypothetical protein